MMAVRESSRFHASLMKDGVDARRLIVNQVLPPSASDCRFCAAKRRVSKLLLFWLLNVAHETMTCSHLVWTGWLHAQVYCLLRFNGY